MPEQGIVKWYSIAKGYGFIRRDSHIKAETGEEKAATEGTGGEVGGAQDDIFVHYSDLSISALNEGERVCFELVSGPKGLKARNVTLAHGSGC